MPSSTSNDDDEADVSAAAKTRCVIFDLDGTLINTEAIVDDVVVSVVTNLLTKKKKKSSSSSNSNVSDVQREIFDAAEDARGQRPLEASMELCDTLKLERRVGVDPKTLLEMCSETLRWGEEGMDAIPDMPGAMRLLRFLKEKKVPTALATSTSKEELLSLIHI